MKNQMKQADRFGAEHALVLEAGGSAKVREMRGGEEQEVDPEDWVETYSRSR